MKITKTEFIKDGFIYCAGGFSNIFQSVSRAPGCGLDLWSRPGVHAGYVDSETTPAALEIMHSLGIEIKEIDA